MLIDGEHWPALLHGVVGVGLSQQCLQAARLKAPNGMVQVRLPELLSSFLQVVYHRPQMADKKNGVVQDLNHVFVPDVVRQHGPQRFDAVPNRASPPLLRYGRLVQASLPLGRGTFHHAPLLGALELELAVGVVIVVLCGLRGRLLTPVNLQEPFHHLLLLLLCHPLTLQCRQYRILTVLHHELV